MAAAAPAPKRARLDAPREPTLLCGDDSELPFSDLRAYQKAVQEHEAAGSQFVDTDFPAEQISIKGKEETTPAPAPTPLQPNVPPQCRCGTAAAAAVVTSETPNKGRDYFRCPSRKCGFFAWADGGFSKGGSAERLGWARMPRELAIVSDYGFRAEDLRQGGVGDCWFMSALAVVAERHDLIARLFAADTARNAAGLYCIRLFLDGAWTQLWIDDQLPVTASPRREALAFDSKLAFCRCSSAVGAQQLWASLIEKAYAKAHGSYQSISGGWVAEALLDLTGAPTVLPAMRGSPQLTVPPLPLPCPCAMASLCPRCACALTPFGLATMWCRR